MDFNIHLKWQLEKKLKRQFTDDVFQILLFIFEKNIVNIYSKIKIREIFIWLISLISPKVCVKYI